MSQDNRVFRTPIFLLEGTEVMIDQTSKILIVGTAGIDRGFHRSLPTCCALKTRPSSQTAVWRACSPKTAATCSNISHATTRRPRRLNHSSKSLSSLSKSSSHALRGGGLTEDRRGRFVQMTIF